MVVVHRMAVPRVRKGKLSLKKNNSGGRNQKIMNKTSETRKLETKTETKNQTRQEGKKKGKGGKLMFDNK